MPPQSRTPSSRRAQREAAERAAADPSRLPLVLGMVAVVLAGLALGWSVLGSGRGPDCQALAWDSIPERADLPAGWAVATNNFFVGNMTVTLEGPAADDATGEGVIYATVSCFGPDGAEALARSRAADAASGSATSDLTGIGNTGYTVSGDNLELTAIHFRRNDIVAYLVIAGTVTADELRTTAAAFDRAIQSARAGDIPTIGPPPTAAPSTPGVEPSDALPTEPASPEPSAVAPDLEALLPDSVADTPFIVGSLTGADILASDPGSRAITAALRALGKTPLDLQVAQAYDEAEELDLYYLAFKLPGVDGDTLRTLVLQNWLVADAEGVTVEEVELAGKSMTLVDYGDELPDAYVYTIDDAIILMHTATDSLAETGAAALP